MNHYDQWLDREKRATDRAWSWGYMTGFVAGLLVSGATFAIGMWVV